MSRQLLKTSMLRNVRATGLKSMSFANPMWRSNTLTSYRNMATFVQPLGLASEEQKAKLIAKQEAHAARTRKTKSPTLNELITMKGPGVNEAAIQKLEETLEDSTSPHEAEIAQLMMKPWYQISLMKPAFEKRKKEAMQLYTASADLDKLSEEDIGKYFPVDIDRIPLNLQAAVREELESTGGYVMLRQPFYELVETLPKVMDCVTPPRVRDPQTGQLTRGENIITVQGHRGTGKSTLLAFASQLALAYENTLLLPVNFADIKDMEGLVRASSRREGVVNQHLFTRRFFEEFAIANKELLQGAVLQGDYSAVPWETAPHVMFEPPKSAAGSQGDTLPFPSRDEVPFPEKKPETVYDLCCLGAWRADLAPELFYSFCYELQNATNMNVVVLFDSINSVDQPCEYRHPETLKHVLYRDLSFVHALLGLLTTPPKRGFVMAAVSSNATMKNAKHYMSSGLLNVELVNYTKLEMQNMFDHYSMSRFLRYEPEPDTFRRAEVLTNGNPKDCYRICSTL